MPDVEKFFRRRLKLVAIFAALWSLSLLGCLYVEYDFHCQLQAREKFIAAHRNDDLITVKPIKIPKWSETFLGTRTWDNMTLWVGGDLESTPDGDRAITFACYHGLKEVIADMDAWSKQKQFILY